jgi:hypothetical protein
MVKNMTMEKMDGPNSPFSEELFSKLPDFLEREP